MEKDCFRLRLPIETCFGQTQPNYMNAGPNLKKKKKKRYIASRIAQKDYNKCTHASRSVRCSELSANDHSDNANMLVFSRYDVYHVYHMLAFANLH